MYVAVGSYDIGGQVRRLLARGLGAKRLHRGRGSQGGPGQVVGWRRKKHSLSARMLRFSIFHLIDHLVGRGLALELHAGRADGGLAVQEARGALHGTVVGALLSHLHAVHPCIIPPVLEVFGELR